MMPLLGLEEEGLFHEHLYQQNLEEVVVDLYLWEHQVPVEQTELMVVDEVLLLQLQSVALMLSEPLRVQVHLLASISL